MRHQAKGRQLSRTSEHRKALMRNMATSLILHGGIETTVAKAKEVRPFIERLITLAKRGTLPAETVVAGHSVGELTAAAIAGVISADEAITLAAVRGEAMAQACATEPTTMAAVLGGDEQAVLDRLAEH